MSDAPDPDESVRPSVGAALERARAFVDASREPASAAFLAALCGDPAPLLAIAERAQTDDGALASLLPGAPEGPGVASTADGMSALLAASIREGDVLERAAGYLQAKQQADGSWRDAAVREPLAALALCGHVCGVLGQTPYARLRTLDRGIEALADGWSVDRVQEGRLDVIAGYLHALSACHSELADEALQWCGRELERGWRTGGFAAPAVARVFVLCDAAALPAAKVAADDVAAALLAAQREDGSWDGSLRSTLEAAAALVRHEPGGPEHRC